MFGKESLTSHEENRERRGDQSLQYQRMKNGVILSQLHPEGYRNVSGGAIPLSRTDRKEAMSRSRLHQIGLNALVAFEVGVDKQGPNPKAVFGVDSPHGFAYKSYRFCFGGKIEDDFESHVGRVDGKRMEMILRQDKSDTA